MAKVSETQTSEKIRALEGKFLILKRSAQPAFYERSGMAEIPGYGTGRRSLVGLEASVQLLQEQNLPVELFEPGSVTLAQQILAFSTCQGISGIFGAEFANVVWMQPGTSVIWIYNSTASRIPWITRELSQLLKLRFVPIKAANDVAPSLPVNSLRNWLLGRPIVEQ